MKNCWRLSNQKNSRDYFMDSYVPSCSDLIVFCVLTPPKLLLLIMVLCLSSSLSSQSVVYSSISSHNSFFSPFPPSWLSKLYSLFPIWEALELITKCSLSGYFCLNRFYLYVVFILTAAIEPNKTSSSQTLTSKKGGKISASWIGIFAMFGRRSLSSRLVSIVI